MKPAEIRGLRIVNYPDPRLRKVCRPVDRFDKTLAMLAKRMLFLMHEADGIGLAGPQVGILRRLFVCNVTGEPDDDHVFINPSLSHFSGEDDREEGCLSLPEVAVTMRRSLSCEIHAIDVKGKPIEMAGTELAARCWQHECDHLEGRLIIDRMSESDKIANRRALKYLESQFTRSATAR